VIESHTDSFSTEYHTSAERIQYDSYSGRVYEFEDLSLFATFFHVLNRKTQRKKCILLPHY